MIRGQCTQVLLDKMKHDPDWETTTKSSDPLLLLDLIEKIVLAQGADQYPFTTIYEQQRELMAFQQNNLTNEQWYERFNTKVGVAKAIGRGNSLTDILPPYISLTDNLAFSR